MGLNFVLEDLNEREMFGPRMQSMFKRSRHNILSLFVIDQYHYERSKRMIRADGKIYHIFQPKKLRDVQNLHQHKASMHMTLNETKFSTSAGWNDSVKL